MLLLHTDWIIVKNVSNQGGANSVTAALWHSKSQPRMLVASKIAFLKNCLAVALGFLMDLRLNVTRRSINPSVYLVFDLEARRFKFLVENLLGAGVEENEPSTPDSFSYEHVDFTVNAKPIRSLKFAILCRKSFVTSKQFKWKA